MRLQRSFETTKIIAEWLQQHPAVDSLVWPFASNFKQAELAHQQMQGCGGLFSFTLKEPSLKKIERFCDNLQHILLAVSWGGHESLVIPAISGIADTEYMASNDRHQWIRMYVGLEDATYLINDLEQALAGM